VSQPASSRSRYLAGVVTCFASTNVIVKVPSEADVHHPTS
jgi:hypothetical protein